MQAFWHKIKGVQTEDSVWAKASRFLFSNKTWKCVCVCVCALYIYIYGHLWNVILLNFDGIAIKYTLKEYIENISLSIYTLREEKNVAFKWRKPCCLLCVKYQLSGEWEVYDFANL